MDPDSWAWGGNCSRDCSQRHTWGLLSRLMSLLCLLGQSPPICYWCLFFTFLPPSGLHKIFVDSFSISSALLQVFVLFLLPSHPLCVTVTLPLLLLLIIIYHWFLCTILSRTAPPRWDSGWYWDTPLSTQVESSQPKAASGLVCNNLILIY